MPALLHLSLGNTIGWVGFKAAEIVCVLARTSLCRLHQLLGHLHRDLGLGLGLLRGRRAKFRLSILKRNEEVHHAAGFVSKAKLII